MAPPIADTGPAGRDATSLAFGLVDAQDGWPLVRGRAVRSGPTTDELDRLASAPPLTCPTEVARLARHA